MENKRRSSVGSRWTGKEAEWVSEETWRAADKEALSGSDSGTWRGQLASWVAGGERPTQGALLYNSSSDSQITPLSVGFHQNTALQNPE